MPITTEQFKDALKVIHPSWLPIFMEHKQHMKAAFSAIEGCDRLSPTYDKIFSAFSTRVGSIRAVIVGQDPYIGVGEATGRSFESGVGTPPSLKNIYKCLLHQKLITEMPTSGCLQNWVDQGILLLNAALTTVIGESNAHAAFWAPFTNGILSSLSKDKNIKFVLWGGFAKAKKRFCGTNVHEWGHPSPLNRDNSSGNPKHFINCDVFAKIDIDWNPTKYLALTAHAVPDTALALTAPAAPIVAVVAPVALDTAPVAVPSCTVEMDLFTDGGATNNGKEACRAKYAYNLVVRNSMKDLLLSGSNDVALVTIPGKKYKTSNQRAELTAILEGLKSSLTYIESLRDGSGCSGSSGMAPSGLRIISDSEYGIKVIKGIYKAKANLDLIDPIKNIINAAKPFHIEFIHTNSHRSEPTDPVEKYYWYWNDKVDKLAAGG